MSLQPFKSVLTVVACSGIALLGAGGAAASAAPTIVPTAIPAVVGPESAQDLSVATAIVATHQSSGVTTAAGGWNRCPNGNMCLFSEYNGQGAMAWFRTGSPNLAAQHFANRTKSTWDRASGVWTFWTEANYQGSSYGFFVPPSNVLIGKMGSLKRVG